ncbi:T9SS type B sorting domain-containing protein [Salinimicrobium soli]|uniref:T9SS type B sorting domain-containing protein n=1 Tax=Salinimicrobium soli TaxID=1254399 RepID=UPI003AAD5D45
MRIFFLLMLLIATSSANAQLGFCSGSKGDPIFHEDFTGITSLQSNVTTYNFVSRNPDDGDYTISSQLGIHNGNWHTSFPQTTKSNGQALIVNASFSAGKFYQFKVTNLCESTTYEFSAFLMNVYNRATNYCPDGGFPINVKFQIWDETDTVLLGEGDTGDIGSTNTPQWKQYALTFRSQPGQGSIILKMFNNGVGGCGNDLAIDDIIFRSCGDFTEINTYDDQPSPYGICEEDTPAAVTLNAQSESIVYNTHFYQWQKSTDDANWTDIAGETQNILQVSGITSSAYYRVKVAEDAANLSGSFCNSASDGFLVKVLKTPLAPISNGDKTSCSNESIPELSVKVEADEKVDWYNAPSGGNLLAENTTYFQPAQAGTYYAQASKKDYNCVPGPRTAVKLVINPAPSAEDETAYLCSGSSIVLDAGIPNLNYTWSTGESTQQITITSAGNYYVEITNSNNCSTTKNFEVSAVQLPVIKDIRSLERTVNIDLQAQGNFEYSLDGQNFQLSNEFLNVKGGIYTAYVRNINGCETVFRQFAHLVIPQYITPNNDGQNDFFEVRGISFFGKSYIRIFDRYGKLIKSGYGAGFRWDGTFSDKPMAAEDYWYEITIEGFAPKKGHFSLLR